MNENKTIVGIGYNSMPDKCPDGAFPWDRDKNKDWLDTKYPYGQLLQLRCA